MLRSKTVFIVGAGASREARLPTSVELTGKIATKLNLSAALPLLTQLEPLPQLDTGDPAIAQAIIDHLQTVDKADIAHFRSFIEAAWKTRNAMPQALSIDSFIHAHRDDAEIGLCGKLGIAQVILSEEGESTLCFVDKKDDEVGVRHEQLVDTWYLRCFQLLYEDVVKSQMASLFENASFVIFNYDRCVEHYLYNSLRNWYGIPAGDCEELLRKCKFLHPYGVVGCLPWQDRSKSVSFGGQHRNINLLEISAQIKTFTERIENEGALAAIRDEIREAETVVFLGFAFHPLNMQLLSPEKPSNTKRVFGTALGLSFTDVQTVNRAVVEMLRGAYASYDNLTVSINNQLSCRALFDEYWRTLSRGV